MAFDPQKVGNAARTLVRHPRTRKIAIWIVSIIAAFGILGALVAPPLVRRISSNQLSEKLHRAVSIEQVRINPFAMTATVRGFVVKERQSQATAISFDELRVNLELASLFRLGPVFKEIRLVKPYINLVRNEDGTYNYQDLIDEFAAGPAPAPGPPPRFSLNNIEIIDGKIDFDDRPEHTKHVISSLRIGVPFISSLPSHVDIKVQPAFSALINDAPLDISGETKPFSNSVESVVNLDIEKVQIPKYLEYSPVPLKFRVLSGQLDGRLKASFKTSKDAASVLSITGNLVLSELLVRQDESELLKLPKLEVVIDSIGVFANKARLQAVRFQGVELQVTRGRDGKLNLANLVEIPAEVENSQGKPAKAETETNPFIYEIDQLLIESSTLHFDDQTPRSPYKTRLDNIRLDAKGLTNAADRKAAVEISFQSAAKEEFDYSAILQLTPFLVDGKFSVKGFQMRPLLPYYQEVVNLELRSGRVNLTGSHSLVQTDKEVLIKVSNLDAAFQDLRLHLAGKAEPLWRVPALAIKDADIDVNKRAISIGAFETQGGNGSVERDRDGTVNYARLFKAQSKSEQPKTSGNATPWQVTARRVAINRYGVVFDDKSLTTPVKIVVTDLSWRQENFSNAKDARSTLTLQAKINGAGVLRLAGSAGTNPVGGKLSVETDGLALVPLQPYFSDRINFLLTAGQVGTKGFLALDTIEQGPMKLSYDGDLKIADFATVEKNGARDLLKWKLMALNGIKFNLDPVQLRIDQIDLTDFYSRVIIGADGKINLQNLTVDNGKKPAAPAEKTPPEKAEVKASPGATTTPKVISIGKIALQRGEINFSDFFVKPNYSANLTSVQGTIAELKPEVSGDIALEAKLDKTAPVDIRGKINPLAKELFMDIKAKASDIELSPFSPYSGRYVGYGIEKGKLTFNVQYKLDNRKLSADTQFILDQLTFGEKIESPDATSLPVKLAVALLKDRNGVIDVGLPISGSLDDPQFSVGGIVLKLIFNIISKAVTAPFALLGAAFGGGGEELSYIEFDYGRAALTQTAQEKLKTLATAMTNRPGLKLEISARVDPVSDLEGLKRASIETKAKAQKMKELARQGKAPKSVDDVSVEKAEYERFLRAAYGEESFPKPRNFIGLAKDIPVAEMESLMLKYTKIDEGDLRELANRRAQAVRDRLLTSAQITADRLFIVAARGDNADKTLKAKASRVDFSLR